jgi:hypothetical protein
MDELRESSLLFSLEGLLETERERVQREAREAERRRQEELARVAEVAERRRLAAEREREARERRQVLEKERERLELERAEAMRRATVERARFEAEGQLRLVEAEQTRQHELQLLKLREGERASRYRTLSLLSAAACAVSIAGSIVAHFAFVVPAHARTTQQLQSVIESARERADSSERALSIERKKTRELEQAMARMPPAPPTPEAPKAEAPAAVKNPHPSGSRELPPAAPCVDNGDPLNPCLRGGRKR